MPARHIGADHQAKAMLNFRFLPGCQCAFIREFPVLDNQVLVLARQRHLHGAYILDTYVPQCVTGGISVPVGSFAHRLTRSVDKGLSRQHDIFVIRDDQIHLGHHRQKGLGHDSQGRRSRLGDIGNRKRSLPVLISDRYRQDRCSLRQYRTSVWHGIDHVFAFTDNQSAAVSSLHAFRGMRERHEGWIAEHMVNLPVIFFVSLICFFHGHVPGMDELVGSLRPVFKRLAMGMEQGIVSPEIRVFVSKHDTWSQNGSVTHSPIGIYAEIAAVRTADISYRAAVFLPQEGFAKAAVFFKFASQAAVPYHERIFPLVAEAVVDIPVADVRICPAVRTPMRRIGHKGNPVVDILNDVSGMIS